MRHARGRRPVRARLHRLRRDVGGHAGPASTCWSARRKRLEQLALLRDGDAGERARAGHRRHHQPSFACDLKKWLQIMEGLRNGGHAYHATMPTDALARLREVMVETAGLGFDKVRKRTDRTGRKVRRIAESRGIPSVAAEGWKAPGAWW